MSIPIENLHEASNWLLYEIWMLKGLADAIETGQSHNKGVLSNAVVEAFLMHARVLHDFFYKSPIKDDDVVAGHFFPDGDWERIRPEKPTILNTKKTAIDKRLAHMTYARLGTKEEWSWTLIRNELNAPIEAFLHNVSLTSLGSRWVEEGEISSDLSKLLPNFYKGDGYWDQTSFWPADPTVSADHYPGDD